MKRIRLSFAFLALLLLVGCNPYEFRIVEGLKYPVEGKFLSNLNTFEIKGESHILLKSGGTVALRVKSLTQYDANFRMRVIKTGVVKIHFRSVPQEFPKVEPITFTYAPEGSVLTGEARLLPGGDFAKMLPAEGTIHEFDIINDGKYLSIMTDCERIWAVTGRPITEWIIIEALDGAEIELFGIEFAYLELDSVVLPEHRFNSDGKIIGF